VLGKLREKYQKAMEPLGKIVAKLGLTPNIITIISLLFSILSLVFYTAGHLILGAVFIIATGIVDMFDGAVARATKHETRFGAVLDHVLDRYSEFFIVLGIVLSGFVNWVWGFFALFSMIMASFVRAKAESVGRLEKCTVGIAERQEKLILLIGGSFATAVYPFPIIFDLTILAVCVVIVGILSQITVLQRFLYAWRLLEGESNTLSEKQKTE